MMVSHITCVSYVKVHNLIVHKEMLVLVPILIQQWEVSFNIQHDVEAS